MQQRYHSLIFAAVCASKPLDRQSIKQQLHQQLSVPSAAGNWLCKHNLELLDMYQSGHILHTTQAIALSAHM